MFLLFSIVLRVRNKGDYYYFGPFPFQSGRIMARVQSMGMTLYFQMSVKRGSSQLMRRIIPHIPGARFFFSFRIAVDISSAVGGVESTEGLGSIGSFGHEDWKWSSHLWS